MDMLKKLMMEKKSLAEGEAAQRIQEVEEKLAWVKENCTCATCPSSVREETQLGFCHSLMGRSAKVVARKGVSVRIVRSLTPCIHGIRLNISQNTPPIHIFSSALTR
jgi:hypothetical protein